MKAFIKKISILIAITVLVCLLFVAFDIFVVKNQYSQGYNAAMLDKIDRLKAIDEPKIVLIGDSNVAFGINSKMIEEEFNMPVVNLGLHGGIGNAYYESLISPYINDGDIVIIGYCSFTSNSFFPDRGLAFTLLEKNNELWQGVNAKEKNNLLKAYPYYVYSCFTKFITFTGNKGESTCYSRDAFNEYGDIIKRPGEENRFEKISVFEGTVKVPGLPNEDSIQRINAFNEYVNGKGATLLIAASPVFKSQYTPELKEFEKLEKALDKTLDCTMISRYENYFFERELFYDTVLHLNEKGAQERTKQLIADIKNYLNK